MKRIHQILQDYRWLAQQLGWFILWNVAVIANFITLAVVGLSKSGRNSLKWEAALRSVCWARRDLTEWRKDEHSKN